MTVSSPNRNIVTRCGPCAEKRRRVDRTKCVTTLLNFLHMLLRKVFEEVYKYRISAYIVSKKEDGNIKKQKSAEILSKAMRIEGQAFKMNGSVRKRAGGLVHPRNCGRK